MSKSYSAYVVIPPRPQGRAQRRRWQREVAELKKAQHREERMQLARSQTRKMHAVENCLRASRQESRPPPESLFGWLMSDHWARRHIRALVPVMSERDPDLLAPEHAEVLKRLVRCSWIRPVVDWQPKGKSPATRMRSLVEHLLVRYRVPQFLYDALLSPIPTTGSRGAAPLFAWLAAGGSLRGHPGQAMLPLPLTRRMRHLFLTSPSGVSVQFAARRAQVLAWGGGELLARVLSTKLDEGRIRGSDDFWWQAVGWLCRQQGLEHREAGDLVDYIAHRMVEDRSYSLSGRTLVSVRRATLEWHAELAKIRMLASLTFPPSGYSPGIWERAPRQHAKPRIPEVWTMEEIVNARDLVKEGRAMRHCVGGYADLMKSGKFSIWSLQCDGRRRLTVEVYHSEERIAQACGRCNRQPRRTERIYLKRWARENKLEVEDWL